MSITVNAPGQAAITPPTPVGRTVKGLRTVNEPAKLPDVAVPENQDGIDQLRGEIDAIDAELVRLVMRRTALSNAIGAARKSLGGPRIVYSREMAILDRFRALGPAGTDLGMLLLSMGRGQLGRK